MSLKGDVLRWWRRVTGATSPHKAVKDEIAQSYAQRFQGDAREERDGFKVLSYDRDGVFDYDFYREAQVKANKGKLDAQWVDEARIGNLAAVVLRYRPQPTFGLCHGARSGKEQAWFSAQLPGLPEVLGTDISDTADAFPNSVVWDFHETNPDWSGRADFVYSNSWDHAYDPQKAFAAWIDALRPGGVMLLDCSSGHLPSAVSAMDPFGATPEALETALTEWFSEMGHVVDITDTGARRAETIRTVVFQRNP